jgi:osmotically-inducible protein OsmY
MRRLTIFTAAALAVASIGCSTATNTNVTANKAMNANSNVAVVVNNNSNAAANTGSITSSNSRSWNSNITREEYDKNKEDYAGRAKETGSTVGSGLNDGWIWTKTKSALATSNDLRDSTINVDVENAVITLRGSVATAAQKAAAEAAAKGIDGQKGIKNQLTVNASDSMTNQMTGSNGTTTNTNANRR